MIYCVAFEDVAAHLRSLGFREVRRYEATIRFERGEDLITLRAPNVNGAVPEILVDDAFDAAGLHPPEWRVFWCD